MLTRFSVASETALNTHGRGNNTRQGAITEDGTNKLIIKDVLFTSNLLVHPYIGAPAQHRLTRSLYLLQMAFYYLKLLLEFIINPQLYVIKDPCWPATTTSKQEKSVKGKLLLNAPTPIMH